MTKLAIFDLDGTLLDTNEVDGDCFIRAVRDVTGIDCSGLRWSSFEHVTDRGITLELLRRHGLPASGVMRVRERFLELLAAEPRERFQPIPGASELIDALPSRGWKAVIATGAWGASAEIKLQGRFAALPVSSCDIGISREEIVRHAIGHERYDRIVSIGDGDWDLATARNLGLPFVRVTRDCGHVLDALESAE